MKTVRQQKKVLHLYLMKRRSERMDLVLWLQEWYRQNCNGQWENFYGIKIETLDNPGWRVRIDLKETKYENLELKKVERDRGISDWITYEIVDGVFVGAGDCTKLGELLQAFREQVENTRDSL